MSIVGLIIPLIKKIKQSKKNTNDKPKRRKNKKKNLKKKKKLHRKRKIKPKKRKRCNTKKNDTKNPYFNTPGRIEQNTDY